LKKFLRENKVVLDTSVIVEYIIENSSYADLLEIIFSGKYRGKLYVNLVTITETLYVAERIYKLAGVRNSNQKALEFVDWVKSHVVLIPANEDISILAGEVKKRFHLSISDAYVIATGQKINAKILFRGVEKEMKKHEKELRSMGVRFLSDFIK